MHICINIYCYEKLFIEIGAIKAIPPSTVLFSLFSVYLNLVSLREIFNPIYLPPPLLPPPPLDFTQIDSTFTSPPPIPFSVFPPIDSPYLFPSSIFFSTARVSTSRNICN